MTLDELEKHSPLAFYYDVKDQLKQHIFKRSIRALADGDAARDAIQSVDQVEARRQYIKEKFIESIGGLPESKASLYANTVGVLQCDGFKIEKVIFESRPQNYITANLYIPDGNTSQRGAVLFLCGHHEEAKHVEEYQAVCQYLVHVGLVVLAQDPIGQGERLSYYETTIHNTTVGWGTEEHTYAGCQCWPLGDGIARYFIHDAMRGIDYLCSRPEVDPERIGVTGNSGGGTQTCMLIMCDPRIAAAAPATFLMNRETYLYADGPQDSEQIWPGLTELGIDHEDILIAMVPKPVLVLAAKYDFFPIEGTRRTVERARRFWEMYDKGSHIELFEDESTHKYTRNMARKAAGFFSYHLSGSEILPEDALMQPVNPYLLRCTHQGQVKSELDGACFVYEENIERLNALQDIQNRLTDKEKKKRALSWINERVFSYRKPCGLNPRFCSSEQVGDLMAQMCFWWAQEGIFNYAVLLCNYKFAGMELPVTIAVWDGGTTKLRTHSDWIMEECSKGRSVMVLDVSGMGALMPVSTDCYPALDFYGIIFKYAHNLMWLNDSLAALRTYDVLRSVDMVEQWPGLDKTDIKLYAHGRYGIYAHFAAFLDKRVKNLTVTDGMISYEGFVKARHYDKYDIMSVIMPGMLKYCDLPDLAKWLGKR